MANFGELRKAEVQLPRKPIRRSSHSGHSRKSRVAPLLVRLLSVPTFLIEGPYRFFCYSNEGNEPPHVHVERDRNTAKFWLEEPVRFARNSGFAAHELTRIQSLVEDHRAGCLRKWNDHFGG
ncbi:MAG TPA: DUF4160 domain-containing protein [Rubrobacter sp.]|nr:DUF4160 domain-containing protein [Rubrobacter sp.]